MKMIPFVFQCVPPSIRVFPYPRKVIAKTRSSGTMFLE